MFGFTLEQQSLQPDGLMVDLFRDHLVLKEFPALKGRQDLQGPKVPLALEYPMHR
jgi:hypothetical protein